MLELNRATFLLQQGYRYWDAKRAGKSMPSRADIDPIEMPALLPHVVLLEVLRDIEPGQTVAAVNLLNVDGLHRMIDWYFATKDPDEVRAIMASG